MVRDARRLRRAPKDLGTVGLAAITALSLLSLGLVSLTWPIQVDTPIMLYAAYLISEFGVTPYAELFDFNMPGVYVVYILIGTVFGYTDLGAHAGDLCLLGVLLALVGRVMTPFGPRPCLAAVFMTGTLYLGHGPYLTLQRDFLILLPLTGTLVFLSESSLTFRNALAVGALLAIAALIKPQALLFSALLVSPFYAARRKGWLCVAGVMMGAAVPSLVVVLYLAINGALGAFLDIAWNYWPLYNDFGGRPPYRLFNGSEKMFYVVTAFLLERPATQWLLIPGVLGAARVLGVAAATESQRHIVRLLAAAAILGQFYVLIPSKFWDPHWFPSLFFLALLGSLSLWSGGRKPSFAFIATIVAALIVVGHNIVARIEMSTRNQDQSAQLAAVLRPLARPGDTVQVLDWTRGGAHAALLARLPLATRYLYDFHFYHHVSHDYIREQRGRLLAELSRSAPRFVLAMVHDKAFSGPDTATTFEELDRWLTDRYRPVAADATFTVYERRTGTEVMR